jgi:hypothetical protein
MPRFHKLPICQDLTFLFHSNLLSLNTSRIIGIFKQSFRAMSIAYLLGSYIKWREKMYYSSTLFTIHSSSHEKRLNLELAGYGKPISLLLKSIYTINN